MDESLKELLDKFTQGLSTLLGKKELPVIKSVETEERKALFVVLEPDVVDLHGDTYDSKEVEKAAINFNKHCQKANFFHKVELQEAEILQSYITPAAFELETLDGKQTIKKGTWLQEWYFPDTDVGNTLWDGVKSGEFNGVSIGAKATVEDLND